MPDNSSCHSKTDSLILKKSSRACDRCHKRRIKCQFDSSMGKCLNCHKFLHNCTFHRVPQKRGPHRKKWNITTSINFKSPSFSIIVNKNALNLSTINMPGYRIDKENGEVCMPKDTIILNPENVEKIISIIDEQLPIKISNRMSHSLSSILETYYQNFHDDLGIFPLDSISQFQNTILDIVKEKKLIMVFHSILETLFHGDELEKKKEWKLLWSQLVAIDYIEAVTDCILYLICHLLICIMVPINPKVLGYCVGTYYEIYKKMPTDINLRIRRVIQLLNLLNQRFNNMDSMFTIVTNNHDDTFFIKDNISEIITILNNENDLKPLKLISFKNVNHIWLDNCEIEQKKKLFIKALQNENIDFKNVVNTLCSLIISMLGLLRRVDSGNYTNSILQILKNRNKTQYKYEFGLRLIINKLKQLYDIIKDTPSFLINMVMYSNLNDTDLVMNQLSTSLNELVQITTLINKLSRNDYKSNCYSNNSSNNSNHNNCSANISYILCENQGQHNNIHNNSERRKVKPNSPSLENLINNNIKSQNENLLFESSLRDPGTNISIANQNTLSQKLNQLSKRLQAIG